MKKKKLLLFVTAVIIVNAVSFSIVNYSGDRVGVLSRIEALTNAESGDECYQNMGYCHIGGSTVPTMTYTCSTSKTAESCRRYAEGCGCDD